MLDGLLVPVVNDLLAGGIPLPSLSGLGINLTDTSLQLGSGYISFATNFTVGSPSAAAVVPLPQTPATAHTLRGAAK